MPQHFEEIQRREVLAQSRFEQVRGLITEGAFKKVKVAMPYLHIQSKPDEVFMSMENQFVYGYGRFEIKVGIVNCGFDSRFDILVWRRGQGEFLIDKILNYPQSQAYWRLA